MENLRYLLVAFALGVPPGMVVGFLVGHYAGKAQLLERYLGLEVGWGPRSEVL